MRQLQQKHSFLQKRADAPSKHWGFYKMWAVISALEHTKHFMKSIISALEHTKHLMKSIISALEHYWALEKTLIPPRRLFLPVAYIFPIYSQYIPYIFPIDSPYIPYIFPYIPYIFLIYIPATVPYIFLYIYIFPIYSSHTYFRIPDLGAKHQFRVQFILERILGILTLRNGSSPVQNIFLESYGEYMGNI